MRILLTNDDGIEAPGLAALYGAIRDLGEVHIVAPADVRSATSHAVTFHKPIPTRRRRIADAAGQVVLEGTAVDGHPADCVKLALHHLVPQPIDLVISGMNSGANVGVNVFYSGTVGAAREAAIWGIPSVAVSLHIGRRRNIRWPRAAAIAREVLDRLLTHHIEPHTLLNVNIPILDDGREPAGLRVAALSTSRIVEDYTYTDQPDGRRHFVASDVFDFHVKAPDTDVQALFAGYTTVTPLTFDPTCPRGIKTWTARLTPRP